MLKTSSRTITLGIAALAAFASACAAGEPALRAAGKQGAPVKIEATTVGAIDPGQPGEILVRLVPTASVDRLTLTLRAGAGLTLQSGDSKLYSAPAAGVPLTHRATVMGAKEGHYRISAVVTTETAGASIGRVLSIPVVVGNPAQVQKQRLKSKAPTDSTGERIKSLPAQEPVR